MGNRKRPPPPAPATTPIQLTTADLGFLPTEEEGTAAMLDSDAQRAAVLDATISDSIDGAEAASATSRPALLRALRETADSLDNVAAILSSLAISIREIVRGGR